MGLEVSIVVTYTEIIMIGRGHKRGLPGIFGDILCFLNWTLCYTGMFTLKIQKTGCLKCMHFSAFLLYFH